MQYRLIESFSTLLHRRTTDNRFLELHQKISEFTDRNNFPSENAKKPRRKREFEAGFEIRGKEQKVVSGSARWKRRWNLAEISFYYRNWIERERERDRNSKQVNEVSWLFVREQIKFRFKLETRWIANDSIDASISYPCSMERFGQFDESCAKFDSKESTFEAFEDNGSRAWQIQGNEVFPLPGIFSLSFYEHSGQPRPTNVSYVRESRGGIDSRKTRRRRKLLFLF